MLITGWVLHLSMLETSNSVGDWVTILLVIPSFEGRVLLSIHRTTSIDRSRDTNTADEFICFNLQYLIDKKTRSWTAKVRLKWKNYQSSGARTIMEKWIETYNERYLAILSIDSSIVGDSNGEAQWTLTDSNSGITARRDDCRELARGFITVSYIQSLQYTYIRTINLNTDLNISELSIIFHTFSNFLRYQKWWKLPSKQQTNILFIYKYTGRTHQSITFGQL